MIPKIIHYCWFGRNPLPPLAQECIASWRKYLPDYEIKEWNEDNFDVNIIPYTAEAYRQKKYAFVSDYARFWILHPFLKKMLDIYAGMKFELPPEDISWYKTIVAYTTEALCKEGLQNVSGIQSVMGINIYPHEYFAPINVLTSRLNITPNTRTVHRYMGSWGTGKRSLKDRMRWLVPEVLFVIYNKIKRRRYRIK